MASSQAKFYGTLGVITLAGVGLLGYVATRDDPLSTPDRTVAPAAATPGGPLVSADVGVTKGSADAPVTLDEYADYQCPYCGLVAQLTIPGIVERYVETGKVRYTFFDFPVHPGNKSYLAAEAARCAGDQGAFWPMHDILFARRPEWSAKRSPVRSFRDYAGQLGLDAGALKRCLDAGTHRDVVQASRRRGEQQGVNSTPTFIINGERLLEGALGFDQLAAIIEEELARQ